MNEETEFLLKREFKIIIIGDIKVGKTKFLCTFVKNKDFNEITPMCKGNVAMPICKGNVGILRNQNGRTSTILRNDSQVLNVEVWDTFGRLLFCQLPNKSYNKAE